ncbi:hypothetical protein KC950_02975 [Candidatus Saccharibacteria bacterium]|nr:hypothetical protein [Candidatus Saccharibacteria bacterium]
MSEILQTDPNNITNQEFINKISSADNVSRLNEMWGHRVRQEMDAQLHQDIERGGVIGVVARVELFLGKIANHAIKN